MKITLLGWNENGEKCLSILLKHNISIVNVLVPKGFETKRMFSIAKKYSLPIKETTGTEIEIKKELLTYKSDLLIVASFHKLLKKQLLEIPQYGAINVHAAALPKYRGYHPLNWAFIKDEKEIGVTVHYIDNGTDSGDILAQKLIPISNYDNSTSIRKKITTEGAKLLLQVVKRFNNEKKKLKGVKQNEKDASYAPKRYPHEGKINWTNNTRDIFNLIRSLRKPYPNAFSFNNQNEQIEITESFVSREPGEVVAKIKDRYLITTGDGVLLVKTRRKLKIGEVLQ